MPGNDAGAIARCFRFFHMLKNFADFLGPAFGVREDASRHVDPRDV